MPTRGPAATSEGLTAIVQRGEALGFHSVVVADHIVFPTVIRSSYPYTVSGEFPGEGDALELLPLMAFVAGVTNRLRIVSSVMIVPYRNPVVTAKMLATIDVLSRGRVTVGVGVGWLREEFEAVGAASFERRGAVTDEYVRIFKTLWTKSPASYAGEFYQFDSLRCLPQPLQKPHPPTRLTISFKAPVYDASADAATLPDGGRRPFSGSPAQIGEDIAAYGALGVSELIFDFRSPTAAEVIGRMERFAGEVLARVT
ncbi:MAG: hypothetical protein DME16_24470 [Candidatus Rokuibacteriota bacterium]|nr:MAG: hypothetical protein DME16_24470 [Candidatus Rokubacteria bacterium]